MTTSKFATEVAQILLKIQAVKLNPKTPFTWSSGLSSPIYCDNRKILSYWADRERIKKLFSKIIDEFHTYPDAVYGVATAGIAWAALIADEESIDMGYVRSEAKAHGLGNQIEGEIRKNQSVIVVEDLISTGSSSINAVNALRQANMNVLGLVSIFSYNFEKASTTFTEAKVEAISLCDFSTLIEVAKNYNHITFEEYDLLASWNQNPKAWSDNFVNNQNS